MMRNQIPGIFAALLYICGFLLFLEWLYPINQVTDTSDIGFFIGYALFCFIISMLLLPWWLSVLMKGAGLLLIIHRLFYITNLLDITWIRQFIEAIMQNIELFYTKQWYSFTPEFRSFLFIILIWLMSYLIHYWFVYVKRVFLFILLTFIYLTLLDVFTAYDGEWAIVRTFIFSFLALGLTNFSRVVQTEQIHFAWKRSAPYWLLPIALAVLVTSIVGYAAPKTNPKWEDPVPFLREFTGFNGNGPVNKVGYGENDSRLGGDFVQDDTPVFRALVNGEQYWRMESKEIYSGKGWESAPRKTSYKEEKDGIISMSTFSSDIETETGKANLYFKYDKQLPKVAYPYGVSRVFDMGGDDVDLYSENHSGSIYAQKNDEDIKLTEYALNFDQPTYPVDEMKKVTNKDADDVADEYVQVPDELPERVHELAEEITAPYENRYDQAKAVEQYFGQNGFTYQTTDVAVPGKNQDYVDQFLFDTQRGYCDNYSTSMAMLLRTLNIPTRWVKGFTGGEIENRNMFGDGADMYEITNSNAHSWVEVYFPDVGWVPFEPTQGFENPAEFYMHTETQSDNDTLEQPKDNQTADKKEEKKSLEQKRQQEETEAAKPKNKAAQNGKTPKWLLPALITTGAVIGILLLAYLYKKRWHLMTRRVTRHWRTNKDAKQFQKSYQYLLKCLAHEGIQLQTGQTLHEFAKHVDDYYRTNDMSRLTTIYERLVYRNQFKTEDTAEITELWENLLKQIGA